MPFDYTSLLDITHLMTFLGGTAVGAAGTYMADRFTDQRRKKEARKDDRRQFENLRGQMPEFFNEIAADLKTNPDLLIREFVVLPAANLSFNHDKPRFQYYESTHKAIGNYVPLLIQAGYVDVVRSTGTPIYRLRENFVQHIGLL